MKLNYESRKAKPAVTPRANGSSTAVPTDDAAGCLRRLKSSELVSHGDFVGNALQGFELWEGPNGFRADAFVQPIYRRSAGRFGSSKN
jgi:hypothetical protein